MKILYSPNTEYGTGTTSLSEHNFLVSLMAQWYNMYIPYEEVKSQNK
jgi:hypothetical protein